METDIRPDGTVGLKKYLSPIGVWALAFGCSVGWGAFVMPGTTFLPSAGPLGATIGLLIGAVVMFIIGVNYHYLMNRYPDSGGAFTYTKNILGHDHGFLCGWFLVLTYTAILWANATALPLIMRALFGNALQFGFHYSIAGFDIYFGEVAISVAATLGFGLLCAFGRKTVSAAQTAFAIVLIVGVVAAFAAALWKNGGALPAFEPAIVGGAGRLTGVISIIALAPWAFVGFESVTHSAEEIKFPAKKILLIMGAALVTGAAAYVILTLLSVGALPEGYADRAEYLADLGNLEGVKAQPAFYAAQSTFGTIGVAVLGAAAISGIITGLIANYVAASRLMYAMSKEGVMPPVFGKLGKSGVPTAAVLFITAASLVIPFFGRTAIGWIVDVTTIGATIAYAYVSICAAISAAREKKKLNFAAGTIGLVMAVLFALYFLLPDIGADNTISTASYLILVVWSIIGLVVIRALISRDRERRMGKTTIVWIVLLVIIMLVSLLWMRSATRKETVDMTARVADTYEQTIKDEGVVIDENHLEAAEKLLGDEVGQLNASFMNDGVIQMSLILAALLIIMSIFSIIREREREAEEKKMLAEQSSRAKSIFLSNMSHDIRTPMNAVTGYTALAMQEEGLTPKVREYLDKIDASSRHLLSLINDVLDMSRIESGKMEIFPEPGDIVAMVGRVADIFSMQMKSKNIEFAVDSSGVTDRFVVFDENRLMRIILNLVSNAFKFTPSGGKVEVALKETASDGERAEFLLTVADTGIGMSKEFAANVFEAFERERSKTVNGIQGTGLGMAITKSLVELMNGSVRVETELGKGTKFFVELAFDKAPDESGDGAEGVEEEETFDFRGKVLLLAEDNVVNREIATMFLTNEGFVVDGAENGKEAVDKMTAAPAGTYAAVLMDVQMPVMNGYEATRAIRALGGEKGKIPVIAMTANAFAEDVKEAKEAGMDAHVAKPIETDKLKETIRSLLIKAAKEKQ